MSEELQPEVCGECGRPKDAPVSKCAKCGCTDNSGRVIPFGWVEKIDRDQPVIEVELDGKKGRFVRRILICHACAYP